MKRTACLLLLIILISSCSETPMNPTQTLIPIPEETVTFVTSDGIHLAGTLFGEGEIAIILAHQGTYGADQKTWQPFARLLAEQGYTALVFDFRGVGQSEGTLGYGKLDLDVRAAARFLQGRGYQRIACAGASMGGTACIRAAQDFDFIGLIIFASTMTAGSSGDTLSLTAEDLSNLTQPKLFVSAIHDSGLVVRDTQSMYALSSEPKALLFFPGTQHGTNLFGTDVNPELSATLLRFVEFMSTQAVLPALQPITWENAETVQLLRTMKIPDFNKGQISQCSLSFSPDGHQLVGACGKNPVPIWDVHSGFLLRKLYNPPEQIVSCAYSPDGKILACGGFDRTITLWDAITGEPVGTLEGHENPIWELAFAPDGKALVSCSLGLLGGGAGKGDIRLWKMLEGEPAWIYPGTRDYLSVAFDPAGGTIGYGSIGGSVGILDAASGELLRELNDSSINIGDVAFSPTGQWLAAGSDDNRIYLWNTADFALASQLTGHTGYVNGVAFIADSTLLISGSHDKSVGIWNVGEGKLILLLNGHEREVLRVAFSPDGTLIASISWDGTVLLWGIPQ